MGRTEQGRLGGAVTGGRTEGEDRVGRTGEDQEKDREGPVEGSRQQGQPVYRSPQLTPRRKK